jgi:hypothetical protein
MAALMAYAYAPSSFLKIVLHAASSRPQAAGQGLVLTVYTAV